MGRKSVKNLMFDEDSRREFVTGFQKRKLIRKKKATEKFEQQLKEAKRQIKEKVRDTYRKVIPSIPKITDNLGSVNEMEYELPEHIVKVKEIVSDEIADNNDWIGRNRMRFEDETIDNGCRESEADTEKIIPGMSVTSLKEVKKIVTNQASSFMQSNEVFRKKNKLEKLKNRKAAALRRNLLRKERKKLKGRKKK